MNAKFIMVASSLLIIVDLEQLHEKSKAVLVSENPLIGGLIDGTIECSYKKHTVILTNIC